jgi:ABC-type transport system involved in cytochrome bd biosynthesis fused ATPase/permease subunit
VHTDALTDAVARVLGERHVVERVAAEVLAATDLDAVVEAMLEHERTQQAVERALASPGLGRLLVQVLESRLVDDLTERVLASPELERVVEFVATSPQVLDAVTRQTQSLAESGQVVAVLGPNGAGKTTLVRAVATLLRPDEGTLKVLGRDVRTEPDAVRRLIGLAGQFAAVEPAMTGRENLEPRAPRARRGADRGGYGPREPAGRHGPRRADGGDAARARRAHRRRGRRTAPAQPRRGLPRPHRPPGCGRHTHRQGRLRRLR